jgi:ABC-2 type transport system permease protein
MTRLRQIRAVARLDLAEVLRSRWLAVSTVAYALLAIVLVAVGQREAPLLGFTGSARVLFSLSHALIVVVPLVALCGTAPAIGRARDDGSLELLFAQPLSRPSYLLGVTLVRTIAILAPLAIVFVGVTVWGAIGYGEAIPAAYLGRSFAVIAALAWAFAGIGVLISATVRHPVRMLTYVILIWAAGVALVDAGLIGALLHWHVDAHVVFAIAAANPVEDARLALLSGVEPDLATLGPVGFYLSQHVGDGALYLIGVAAPLAWGSLAWLAALLHFRRADIA